MAWAKVSLNLTRAHVTDPMKLNVFHWHIVDSQSFPLEVDGFPELSEEGAYESHKIYSKDDVQEIVKYAGEVRSEVLDLSRHSLRLSLAERGGRDDGDRHAWSYSSSRK